jgi:hypothetical protein
MTRRRRQALDAALRGGVPCGSVTELVGPAGVGKSQLCLMLAASALLDAGGASQGQARPPTLPQLWDPGASGPPPRQRSARRVRHPQRSLPRLASQRGRPGCGRCLWRNA